ncbi:MAG: hypothetical protein U0K83_02885 [Bacteroidales bacterium]|nr:hypothetical protein [Bacteroidales bacterium]
MATCKDNCLFALLCKYNDGISEWCLSNCPLYKNKARYIELPCAVGDTIYHLVHGYIEQEHIKGFIVHFITNGYGFDHMAIGETVFSDPCKARETLQNAEKEYREKLEKRRKALREREGK